MVHGNLNCLDPVKLPVITDYHVISQPGVREGRRLQAIRAFQVDGVFHYLLADPQRLTTEVAPVSTIKLVATPPLATTPYVSALDYCCATPYRMDNHSSTHAMASA